MNENARKLLRRKYNYDRVLSVVTIVACFLTQGTYDDFKRQFLGQVDAMMLIVGQGCLSVLLIIYMAYIFRVTNEMSNLLDTSSHIELQLQELHKAQVATHQVMREACGMLEQMHDPSHGPLTFCVA